MALTCNPSTLGRLKLVNCLRLGVQDQHGQHVETPSLLKIKKISWAWWQVLVIPAAQEAEAGQSLEPRRQSRGRAIVLQPGQLERDFVSKNKQTKTTKDGNLCFQVYSV